MTREEALIVLRNAHRESSCGICLQDELDEYNKETDTWSVLRADEALDMAIEALSAEPSVSIQPKTIANNCDLISRADAMGAVQDHFNADGFKGYDDGQKMMDRIKALPSADRPTEDYSDLPDIPRAYYEKIVGNMSHEINMLKQQLEDRPSGKWIDTGSGQECSKCHEIQYGYDSGRNYCPSCGAFMGGDTDD